MCPNSLSGNVDQAVSLLLLFSDLGFLCRGTSVWLLVTTHPSRVSRPLIGLILPTQ